MEKPGVGRAFPWDRKKNELDPLHCHGDGIAATEA